MRGKYITLGLGLAIIGLAATAQMQTHAQAAGPQFLMTWSAINSYAPAGYAGYILPNQESRIMASVEVISASGRPVDLSGQTMYWYENENLLGGGVGVQRIEFRPYGQAPNVITLRVDIPNYPGGDIEHEINIPVVQPKAVIDAPFPDGNFSGGQITLEALPYFFATTSTAPLTFSWTANDQLVTSEENPMTLQITVPQSTPAGYDIPVTLTIQNSNDSVSAAANINVMYQHQL